MTKYFVHDYINDRWTNFDDWWDLIKAFSNRSFDLEHVAHNPNDMRPINSLSWSDMMDDYINNQCLVSRDLIVYDSLMRVVNIVDLRAGVDKFKPKERKYHYGRLGGHRFFRYDPVPYTGQGHRRWYRHLPKNKAYGVALQEYKDLFPGDARLRNTVCFISKWSDDFPPRCNEKNWKSQSKNRKQWM